MRRGVLAICVVISLPTCVVAQEVRQAPFDSQEAQQEYQKMQERSKRMQEEYRKQQEQELERLKQTAPQLYQERKQAMKRQDKMQAILTAFREGNLTDAQAEQQLFPLVKQETQGEVAGLNERIARLNKQLTFLKQAQQDPDLLVRKRIQLMLGKSTPNPEELFGREP